MNLEDLVYASQKHKVRTFAKKKKRTNSIIDTYANFM